MTAYVYTLNRNFLGRHGLALNDDDYSRLIAAMGVPRLLEGGTVLDSTDMLWSLGSFRRARRELDKDTDHVLPSRYLDAWRQLQKHIKSPRISVGWARQWARAPDPTEVLAALSHPAIEASAVHLEWRCPDINLQWQWPLRVMAFPDDHEELGLERLKDADHWPANALSRPLMIDRDVTRAEILIARTDVRATLGRVLSLGHSIRAGLLMLLTPLDVPWSTLRPRLNTLLAETQAGGIALVQWPAGQPFAPAFNVWMRELSHATPVDVAFGKTFGVGCSMLLLDPKVIDSFALTRAAQTVAGRIERMAVAVDRTPLRPETAENIKELWKRNQPPREFAEELQRRADAGELSFAHESQGASLVSELEAVTRKMENTFAVEEAPRYLLGDLYRYDGSDETREKRGLVVDIRHALDVFIGAPGQAELSADVPIPDDEIEWGDRKSVTLQVLLAEPNQWAEPLRGTLRLPRHGRSEPHRFFFTPNRTGPFRGRVTLYYRGRILQTALLETEVVASHADLDRLPGARDGLTLRVEASVRRSLATLPERRRFDACIVCNHTVTRQAAMTAAGKDGAYIASLGKLENAVARISELLTQVAQDADRYSGGLTTPGNAELLGRLASQGNTLYRQIVLEYIGRSSAATAIRDAEYLQVVTMSPEAIVPLEFIYDLPVPREGAPVCSHAEVALKSGVCPNTCRPSRSPADRVCPLGFWGLRKVIERHIHVPDLPKLAKVLATEPIAGRDTLTLTGSTLVGISKQVGSVGEKQLLGVLKRVRGGAVTQVKSWDRWVEAIDKDKPVMLVTLPHADGTGCDITLEIGGDTGRASTSMRHTYTRSRHGRRSRCCLGATRRRRRTRRAI